MALGVWLGPLLQLSLILRVQRIFCFPRRVLSNISFVIFQN